MDDYEKYQLAKVLEKLQKEWEENEEVHVSARLNMNGIRSSQISALISVLIDYDVFGKKPILHRFGRWIYWRIFKNGKRIPIRI